MKNLLYKEFKLAMHPTTPVFLLLSAMLLIPNYPYYVIFFYTSLGVFFISLNGRENHDIFFTMSLPLRKKDIVKARFLFIGLIEVLQFILAIPFAMLRQSMGAPNAVGMDANIALFGLSLIMMGVFNLVFFLNYYKDPNKPGKAFIWSNVFTWIYIIAAEVCAHVVPLFRDQLDTPDPSFLPQKLVVLAIGIVGFLVLTLLSYRKSVKSFVALDL